MTYYLGIDVGAARASAAVARAGSDDVEPVDLGDGGCGVASVLHLGADGSLDVGVAAERWADDEPDRVVRGFPGRIGDDVPMLLAGEPWAPEELTAWLVRWVVDRVAEREDGPRRRSRSPARPRGTPTALELLAGALAEQDLDATFLTTARAVEWHSDESGTDGVAARRVGGGVWRGTRAAGRWRGSRRSRRRRRTPRGTRAVPQRRQRIADSRERRGRRAAGVGRGARAAQPPLGGLAGRLVRGARGGGSGPRGSGRGRSRRGGSGRRFRRAPGRRVHDGRRAGGRPARRARRVHRNPRRHEHGGPALGVHAAVRAGDRPARPRLWSPRPASSWRCRRSAAGAAGGPPSRTSTRPTSSSRIRRPHRPACPCAARRRW